MDDAMTKDVFLADEQRARGGFILITHLSAAPRKTLAQMNPESAKHM